MRGGVVTIVAAIVLTLPASGQHGGGGHGGSMGHAGFAGHAGFSSPRSFSAPVGGARYGGFNRGAMPMRRGAGVPYRGFGAFRPAYRPGYGNRRGYDRGHRRWYGGVYPGWEYPGWAYISPYPYVIDPGFYDWGDTGDYGDGGSTTSAYAPYADYGMPYGEDPQDPTSADQRYGPSPYPSAQQPYPNQQAPYASPQMPALAEVRPAYGSPTAGIERPLTLIFKNGRAPQTMRNYMMSSTMLTDLDPQHFERIPLGEIDIAATVQTNRARGVDFAVPQAERE